ncbi:tail fiber assembly protein [Morganella morganii]|uniref:tail fiber assembly protein n=1 Tax=Morganella morganii TaxID=582 RepID=UPI0031B070E2
MHTEIIEQKYFKNKDGIACVIDVMPMNKDSWENEIQEGWVAITKKEYQKLIKPSPTKEQQIEQAEAEKQRLIAEVHTETEMLRTKLVLKRIKPDEEARLIAWLDYLDELEAVGVSTAPDIIWPVKPVV